MRNLSRFIRYTLIIFFFIIFNVLLLNSIKEPKVTYEEIKPKIILISHVYSNPYWQYVKSGAEKAAKERGAVIEFQGPDNASVDEGIKFINMAYAAKVSGIITYVQDQARYKSVIDKVVTGGIPIVTVDSDAESSKRLAYVGTDNVTAGSVGAKEMIKQVGTDGDVGIIMGGRNVKNQIERVNGFTDYIKSNSKLVISDIESSDSYLLEAELAAKKIMMNNSNIKAIFCTSALDGQGAAKALISMGATERVKIISFDDLPETMEYIQNGIIASTIVQNPYAMGYKSVNIIMDIMQGKEIKGVFPTDVIVVSKENLNEYKKGQNDYDSKNK
jgi:ribose transport system substrate-binding protein